MSDGPAAGLAIVDELSPPGELAGVSATARGARRPAGQARRTDEARAEFERAAASLTRNQQEQELFLARASSLQTG